LTMPLLLVTSCYVSAPESSNVNDVKYSTANDIEYTGVKTYESQAKYIVNSLVAVTEKFSTLQSVVALETLKGELSNYFAQDMQPSYSNLSLITNGTDINGNFATSWQAYKSDYSLNESHQFIGLLHFVNSQIKNKFDLKTQICSVEISEIFGQVIFKMSNVMWLEDITSPGTPVEGSFRNAYEMMTLKDEDGALKIYQHDFEIAAASEVFKNCASWKESTSAK